MDTTVSFDAAGYLGRIGFEGDPAPDRATLHALHAAHLDRIPFENVDVLLGRPGKLDLGSLQAKLVADGRGGYCFENNTLFAAALRAFGFEVRTLEARVRPPDTTAILPRTHMTLAVDVDGRTWLADVGFGGNGPREPVPMDGERSVQGSETYRVVHEGDGVHALRMARGREPERSLYAFRTIPAEPIDFEVAHHYTSTFPRSPFVTTLTVQRRGADHRHVLRGRTYTAIGPDDERTREIDDAELGGLLADVFGLELAGSVVAEIVDRLPPASATGA